MSHPIRNDDEGDGSYSVEVSPRISKYLHYSTLENGTNAILLEEIERNTEFAEFKFQSGDVLIAINNLPIVSLTRLELEKKIKTLRKRNPASLVKLRFYSPGHQETSTEEYIEFIKSKEYYSLHGFRCSLDEMLKEKRTFQKLFKHREKHSIAWFNYLKSIGGYRNLMPGGLFNHHNNDLRQLIRNGIPTGLRSQIWPQISLSTIYRLSYPKDYYYQLVNSIDERLNTKVVEDIAKDLGRTFPNHPDFDEGSVKRGELQRILSAYGIHNARLGYCQGMNFITATMLLVLSEEESFWLLATIIEKILPPEVYGAMMIDASTDRLVVSHLMKNYFPTIYRNVEEVNQIIFPSFQWFICLYVTYLPFPAVLRIWDIFLSEGHITLYRIIIALLYLYEDPLSKAQDVMELNQVFDDIKMNIDVDLLIHTAYPDRECVATKLSPTALFERSYHNIFSTKKKNHHHHSSTTVIEPKKVMKVPDSLIGVGVAHTGPTLEKFISTRYQPNMDISTHEWVETKRIDEIDEKDEITKSAHRMSASFFNETSTLMRMLTSRGIKTKTKKLKKHRLSFQQLPIVFLLSDEEIMNIRAIFRAVFDLHNQKYQAVLNDIRSAVTKKNEER